MKAFLQEYLAYTRSEQRGILVLVIFCLFILIVPFCLPILFPKEKTDFSTFQEEIAQFEVRQNRAKENKTDLFVFNPNIIDQVGLQKLGLSEKVAKTYLNYRSKFGDFKQKEDLKKVYGLTEKSFQVLEPFIQIEQAKNTTQNEKFTSKVAALTPVAFDPNTVDKKTLMNFGLSGKTASNIINYREQVGRFEQKEDLRKLYSLSKENYEQLVPYIEIVSIEKTDQIIASNDIETISTLPNSYEEEARPKVILDINTASVEEWQQLRGIGAAYAKRIVKFRDALGGFSSTQQVAETYGLPDSTFQDILFSLRPSPVFEKLKINELDAKALKGHPYIKDWKTANIIINYREEHGRFENIEDLKKVKILSDELLVQLSPYLDF